VQSVIPISSILIIVAEVMFLVDLVRHQASPLAHAAPTVDGTH
jgi:hypothetical protein